MEANMDTDDELEQCPGRVPMGGRRFCYEGCPDWQYVQDRLDCPAHLRMCGVCEQRILCPCWQASRRMMTWPLAWRAWQERTKRLTPLQSTVLRPLR